MVVRAPLRSRPVRILPLDENTKTKLAVLKTGSNPLIVFGAVLVLIGFGAADVHAHGFVGDRFFAPTIATNDPFARDELLFPSVSYFKSNGGPPTGSTDGGFEY